ncbi:hypothetical protein DUNSADRAFT_363 [Dunaliella salina]|uniref:Uncharacterized protein n=1 Tax=Dunaliella salina TaxID=3046 RepID=A0ABQ7FZ12_DUNSA|nr:hypothetical protein DUNSADRAFT_363 [Dunaliella salina]|eukprot:KAF5827596.1 hypothetical protein DUNSADRAFT_363 [Dunaliella salina]
MAKKAHPVLKGKSSTQQLLAQQQQQHQQQRQQPHKKRKRAREHGASEPQRQQQQQQQQEQQVPTKKHKTDTSRGASVPVGGHPSLQVKHKQHAGLAPEGTNRKGVSLKIQKRAPGAILKKKGGKSRPWKGSSEAGGAGAQQRGKAARMPPSAGVHPSIKGSEEKPDTVSKTSSKTEESEAARGEAGKLHRPTAKARAKQKIAKRTGTEENREALVKVRIDMGGNWPADQFSLHHGMNERTTLLAWIACGRCPQAGIRCVIHVQADCLGVTHMVGVTMQLASAGYH